MSQVVLRPPLDCGPGLTTIAEAVQTADSGQWIWIDGGRHIMDNIHLADAVGLSLTRGDDAVY